MVEGHCMRCKTGREMKNVKVGQTSRGGYLARGVCTTCGTNMAKILSKEQADKLKK